MNHEHMATTIRQPSVANLMIDSLDKSRPTETAWDFRIVKNQSILNGFFTRIAATEVVLEWDTPNISALWGNDTITITTSAGAVAITLAAGFYTVADVLNVILAALTAAGQAGATFSIVRQNGVYGILSAGVTFVSITPPTAPGVQPNLSAQMNFSPIGPNFIAPVGPDLRPARYLDFISSDLTYAQKLKDASTDKYDRNVLVRWYFAYDNPVPTDEYEFSILMGYSPFYVRRLYNPAKQIRWETNLPVGNLGFQVFNNYGSNDLGNGDWLMTLQVSED